MFHNFSRQFIRNLVVRAVSPPDQHVGILQHTVRQAAFRLVEGGGPGFHPVQPVQKFRDGSMNAFRINSLHLRHFPVVYIFVPYSYADHNAFILSE